ncbi:hypothetical protein PR048_030971 [Dryococelus australis]|uniref:Uncharacterized protein n=1 Tax=Dryococelus australis TaxID=614101 RepID=A0ABQ9GAD3_9NEOP|nr:hypothetical protein PR048_030971 [Dryococelus australis]
MEANVIFEVRNVKFRNFARTMAVIATAHLQLQRAGHRLHRAFLLAAQFLNNPSQQRLSQATCWDLPSIKTSYEDDHLLIEARGDEDTSFNEVEHRKQLEMMLFTRLCVSQSH